MRDTYEKEKTQTLMTETLRKRMRTRPRIISVMLSPRALFLTILLPVNAPLNPLLNIFGFEIIICKTS